MPGGEPPWGNVLLKGHSGECVGLGGGLYLFACCCVEGFMVQGEEGSLCIAKGFGVTLFPCPPSPQPSLPQTAEDEHLFSFSLAKRWVSLVVGFFLFF